MSARPLLAWPRATREAVDRFIDAPWQRWCGEHGLRGHAVRSIAASVGAVRWRAAVANGLQSGVDLLVAVDEAEPGAALARRLFGPTGASPVGRRAALHARAVLAEALTAALSTALPDAVAAPDGDAWCGWSGALLCPLRLDGATATDDPFDMALRLHARVVRALDSSSPHGESPRATASEAAARSAVSSSVWSAVAAEPLHLEIRLQGVELGLGALQSLQPGDVLLLPQALDDPLDVHLAAAHGVNPTPLCHATLGRQGARRAVAFAACAFARASGDPCADRRADASDPRKALR